MDSSIINTFDGFDSVKLPDEELETEEAKKSYHLKIIFHSFLRNPLFKYLSKNL